MRSYGVSTNGRRISKPSSSNCVTVISMVLLASLGATILVLYRTTVIHYNRISRSPSSTNELIGRRGRPPDKPSQSSRRRIGFAITMTKDGAFLDGAAVLAYSIVKSMNSSLHIDFSFIAFVHPTVVTSRPMLRQLGYHVVEAPTPVNISAIRAEFLRQKIDLNGCCGASELIKLNSYRLLQYDKIIHMDADTMILKPIVDLIFEDFSLIYTTDPNMATHKGDKYMPVQGGFIILKPSLQDYENIINIVMTTDFNIGSAWNRTRIGWFWGGMTVQGVLPYYYNAVTTPGRSKKVDRCYYNTMADSEECMTCWKNHDNKLCKELHESWFQLRLETEAFYGLTPTNNVCYRKYHTMNLDSAVFPHVSNYRFDDSPDRIKPTAVSGFITEDYDMHVGGHISHRTANISKDGTVTK